ncbi:hypothetical protein [Sphingomonas quercus]|uniref:GntR family transcriptional regulator n=1 Tax=Sphingomonas quercus TaxID=2842451 RepID=A0ABS6BHW6_9SPHN|nr:hypothetical protein [Sphingomonas quercus]MBU3077894.1 hypothetical protein [Sphingomonas quercus]
MTFHSLSTALWAPSDTEPPLVGLEARIFREFLIVLAAGELRPGAGLCEHDVADIYGITPDRVGHVFQAMQRVGLLSCSPTTGAQVETIAPEDAPGIIERARTVTRYIVERLATAGLDHVGRETLARHIGQQRMAEASGDWPRTNVLSVQFLALLARVDLRHDGFPGFDRQAMRLMLLRASYDRYGEPAPSASTQSLLLNLIVERRTDEAVRVTDALYDGIVQRLWLDGTAEADLRTLLARSQRAERAPDRAALRLVAVDGRRLDD